MRDRRVARTRSGLMDRSHSEGVCVGSGGGSWVVVVEFRWRVANKSRWLEARAKFEREQ